MNFRWVAGKSACICGLTDLTFTEGGGVSDAAMKFTGSGQRECGPGHGELSDERQLQRCRVWKVK